VPQIGAALRRHIASEGGKQASFPALSCRRAGTDVTPLLAPSGISLTQDQTATGRLILSCPDFPNISIGK
jgi:hypothetical protein